MDTNAKTSGLRLAPLAEATTSSAILFQGAEHVHFRAQLLVLFEQLPVEIIFLTNLFSESLYLTLVSL